MCFKNSRESAEPLFASKNILPFHKNLQLQAGKLLWKAANSYLCPSLNPLFHLRDDHLSFHLPHRRLDVSQNSISYSGVKTWNAIPIEIRSTTSPNSFKTKYKEYLNPSQNILDNNFDNFNRENSHRNNNSSRHNHISRLTNNTRLNQPFSSRWNQS